MPGTGCADKSAWSGYSRRHGSYRHQGPNDSPARSCRFRSHKSKGEASLGVTWSPGDEQASTAGSPGDPAVVRSKKRDSVVAARDRPSSESPAHSEAAAAAETFAMHRMTQRNTTSLLVATMAAICATCMALPANAQMVRQADIDFEASGFVTPAGMVHPSMYQGGVRQVGHPCRLRQSPQPTRAPVSMLILVRTATGASSVAATAMRWGTVIPWRTAAATEIRGYCDSPGGCDGSCDGGSGGCLGCCSTLLEGGLLGKLCANDSRCCLRHLCLFCRGGGCSACQGLKYCGAMASCLLPYGKPASVPSAGTTCRSKLSLWATPAAAKVVWSPPTGSKGSPCSISADVRRRRLARRRCSGLRIADLRRRFQHGTDLRGRPGVERPCGGLSRPDRGPHAVLVHQ